MIAPLFIAALLFACQDSSPEAVEARQWASDVEPLLHENSLLAEQVLENAANLYNGVGKPEAVQDQWLSNVVPTAHHLVYQAELVKAPEHWSKRHAELVETWTDRATAYQGIGQALRTGDKAVWTKAREASDHAKLREEKWFKVVNQELEPYDVTLDQFP